MSLHGPPTHDRQPGRAQPRDVARPPALAAHRLGEAAAVGQPRYLCVIDLDGRGGEAVLKSMNQQWRRNVKKADKSGVKVRSIGIDGVDTFHELYVETAERDHFVPRAKSYFELMVRSFSEGGEHVTGRIYEAHVDGDVLASALMVRFGDRFSYLYGGSTSATATPAPATRFSGRRSRTRSTRAARPMTSAASTPRWAPPRPLIGLLLFKLGAGADVVEIVGERELVLSRFWHFGVREGDGSCGSRSTTAAPVPTPPPMPTCRAASRLVEHALGRAVTRLDGDELVVGIEPALDRALAIRTGDANHEHLGWRVEGHQA